MLTQLVAPDLHRRNGQPAVPRLLLTMREAAEALGLCERSVWQLIDRGDIRVIRLPGRGRAARAIRVPFAELERWINDQLAIQHSGESTVAIAETNGRN